MTQQVNDNNIQRLPSMQKNQENMTSNEENTPVTKTGPDMTQMLADKDTETVKIVFHRLQKLSGDMETWKTEKDLN